MASVEQVSALRSRSKNPREKQPATRVLPTPPYASTGLSSKAKAAIATSAQIRSRSSSRGPQTTSMRRGTSSGVGVSSTRRRAGDGAQSLPPTVSTESLNAMLSTANLAVAQTDLSSTGSGIAFSPSTPHRSESPPSSFLNVLSTTATAGCGASIFSKQPHSNKANHDSYLSVEELNMCDAFQFGVGGGIKLHEYHTADAAAARQRRNSGPYGTRFARSQVSADTSLGDATEDGMSTEDGDPKPCCHTTMGAEMQRGERHCYALLEPIWLLMDTGALSIMSKSSNDEIAKMPWLAIKKVELWGHPPRNTAIVTTGTPPSPRGRKGRRGESTMTDAEDELGCGLQIFGRDGSFVCIICNDGNKRAAIWKLLTLKTKGLVLPLPPTWSCGCNANVGSFGPCSPGSNHRSSSKGPHHSHRSHSKQRTVTDDLLLGGESKDWVERQRHLAAERRKDVAMTLYGSTDSLPLSIATRTNRSEQLKLKALSSAATAPISDDQPWPSRRSASSSAARRVSSRPSAAASQLPPPPATPAGLHNTTRSVSPPSRQPVPSSPAGPGYDTYGVPTVAAEALALRNASSPMQQLQYGEPEYLPEQVTSVPSVPSVPSVLAPSTLDEDPSSLEQEPLVEPDDPVMEVEGVGYEAERHDAYNRYSPSLSPTPPGPNHSIASPEAKPIGPFIPTEEDNNNAEAIFAQARQEQLASFASKLAAERAAANWVPPEAAQPLD